MVIDTQSETRLPAITDTLGNASQELQQFNTEYMRFYEELKSYGLTLQGGGKIRKSTA